MYLKRLELQGYKSFARKTEFVFERGITAIVGPNGSGKSNIADAVRWVLGETRMSQLRAKMTDDLIFAGSDSRARLGMAQVSMTLDNSDRTLPIDYTEVTVERRAYRDGQNEYFINGTKVRLRDIVELLGAGGLTRDAYAIIGQGLVDTALSLRPQERRALIDVAAGIRPLQDKRDRALAQLDETHDNLTRVRDIAAEIAPRLRRLENQAERARQGVQIARQLEEVLKTWYGYQWHAGQRALRNARAGAAASRQTLGQRRQELATLEQQIESRRDREEAQADALSDLREQRAGLRGRYEAVRRDLAVRQERTTLLQRRQQELAQEVADLRAARDEQQRQLMGTETASTLLSEECDRLTVQLEVIKRQQAGAQQHRAEYQSALQDARQEAFDLASTLAELHSRLTALTERQATLTRERAIQQDAVTELVARIEKRGAVLEDARRQVEAREEELRQRTRAREAGQSSLQAATTRLDELRTQADDARRHLERLQARRETLAEMRTAGDGDATGAQALLSTRDELSGIIGSLASLIRVPAEYEATIEAALGPNLHAVVVETWADARRALRWLQANQAGRATLIASRGAGEQGSRGVQERRGVGAEGPGVVGAASKLVECEPRFKPLIRRLLGQTIIVDGLDSIHRASPSSPDVPLTSPVFVTLDGTLVHPSGYIIGGSTQAPVLRRERLWRELPAQIQAAEAETRRLERERAGAQMSVESLTRQRAGIEAGLRKTEAAHVEDRAAVEQARRDIEALERELLWQRSLLERHNEELRAIEERTEGLRSRLEHIRPRHADAESCALSLQTQLAELESETLRDDLAEAEKRLAVAQRDRQNQQNRREDLRATLAGLERQIEVKQSQINALVLETDESRARIEVMAGDEGELAEQLDALEAAIAPAEEALRTMRREGRELERKAALASDLLRQAETAVAETSLDVQRREDRLIALRDKIADDLELAALREDLPQQLTLALEGEGEAEVLPAVTEVPEGLERQVKQLRRQMRDLGSASPEIIAEYEETKARHNFLTSQAADLEEAASDLRAMAAELTEIMQEQFTATFDKVSRAFEKYFARLFGGGEAHVRLVEDAESDFLAQSGGGGGRSDPGLEIVARPPGKRSQSLALLSGGERSLTAVALLFALLEASPTPFCVLDEVDAMLDEANIGRFRSALEELARETQFVIVTHNRGTIQAANTIYGISMSAEGVSQAISLRLDELEPVAA